jgi:multiple antibiotic resistance protein
MKELLVVLAFIPFTFSALLPVINPIGSAVLFLGFVQDTDRATKKKLARKIASNTVLFLLFVLVAGTPILRFFGISLPIVEVAGGFVLATMGWTLLTKSDADGARVERGSSLEDLENKAFYPLTFPLTAGPATVVVTLTLSAHASRGTFFEIAMAHVGVLAGIGLIGIVVYIAYAYADRTTARLSPSITQGILRIISFILLCIGAQIMWNGIESVAKTMK